MKCRIRFIQGELKGVAYSLDCDCIHIGRAASNEVRFSETVISKTHAKIIADAEGYLVDVLGTNGMAVGDVKYRMGESFRLSPGQTIHLSSKNVFVVEELPIAVLSKDANGSSGISTYDGGQATQDGGDCGNHTVDAGGAPGASPANGRGYRPWGERWNWPQVRMAACGAAALALLALLGWALMSFPHGRERSLGWPLDHGVAAKGIVDLPEIVPVPGCIGGQLSIEYPLANGARYSRADGLVEIRTAIGRGAEVPFYIILFYSRDRRLLSEERWTSMERWMTSKSGGKSAWDFGVPGTVAFIGADNGVPAIPVEYTRRREGKKVWGIAKFMRLGEMQLVLCTELPEEARERGRSMASGNYLSLTEDVVKCSWEGMAEACGLPWASAMKLAAEHVRSDAPCRWSAAEFLVRSCLCRSAEGDSQAYSASLELLRELREAQRGWFDVQRIAYRRASGADDWEECQRIAGRCRAVFANSWDRRYDEVRRWRQAE